jgi:hypothetical protein
MNCKKAIILGMLSLVLFSAGAVEWRVEVRDGAPRLLRDGKVVHNRMFFANPAWSRKDYAEATMSEIGLAQQHDIELVSICLYNPPWKSDPADDEFKAWHAILDRIFAAYPDVKLILRIKLDSPPFVKKDPSQMMLTSLNRRDQVSIASRRYRKEMPEVFRAAIRHLEKRYGDRIAGYHPAGGNWSEWQYRNFALDKNLHGYDPETLIAFKNWLVQKYQTNEALAKAWNKPGITFETVTVPTPGERVGKEKQGLHNPKDEQHIIDFNFFLNDDMVAAALSNARVIREECGRKKLSVIFYGYTFEVAALPNGPASCGHNALRTMLDSPDVDIICGPFSYNYPARVPGGSEQTHTVGESIMRAGKLWLNEDDSTTPLAIKKKQYAAGDHTFDRDNRIMAQIHRRNLAFGYARNYGLWWMDLHGSGWLDDPEYWKVMKSFQKLEDELLAEPTAYQPDVALITDEKSLQYVVASLAPYDMMLGNVTLMRDSVSRSATSHGSWLLDDVLAGKVQSKLDIYTGIYALTGEQRKQLRKRADKVATIWCWAPGYIDLDKKDFSLKSVEELTGFKVKMVDHLHPTWDAFTRPYGARMGLPVSFGWGMAVSPVLSPIPEPGDEILAIFSNRYDRVAVLYRPGKDGKAPSVFCGTNELPPELIRKIAELAGAKVYANRNAHIHANDRFIALTAPVDGIYDIQVGGNEQWEDALSGEKLGNGPVILRSMKLGDTVVLKKSPVQK